MLSEIKDLFMTDVTPTAQCHNSSVPISVSHIHSTLKHATGNTKECMCNFKC